MRKAYLIGIKGAGMAALAQFFKKNNWEVVGSDVKEKFFTDRILKREKIEVKEGFSKDNVCLGADIFVASNAYLLKESKNPEVLFLREKKKKIYSYPQAMALFFNRSKGIAVCGTHGKSTTTSLIGLILKEAGLEPKVVIGAKSLNWQSNAFLGGGDLFVLEADEYQNAFLNYQPRMIVFNSIEYDHSDFFKSKKSYFQSFRKFLKNLKDKGRAIAFEKDCSRIFNLPFKKRKKRIVVFDKEGRILRSFELIERGLSGSFFAFDLKEENNLCQNFQIKFGGVYLLNAALSVVLGISLNLPLKKIKESLRKYKGVERRFQISKKNKLIVVDDFAHHPTAIAKTIALTRETFKGKKILAVFQPHTFSRTKTFLTGFAKSLSLADKVVLLPVFASAREKKGEISSKDILKKGKRGKFLLAGSFFEAKEMIESFLGKENQFIILLLGAGDIYKLKKLL